MSVRPDSLITTPFAVLTLFLALSTAATATPAVHPAPALVPVSGASPFAAGCVDMETPGFGRGFTDAEAEVSLAVSPNDSRWLVAAWMQDLYGGYVTSSSADGGRSWSPPQVVPGVSRCSAGDQDLAADPWLSIGPDDVTYLAGFSLDLPDPSLAVPYRTRLQVSTSDDHGRTWASAVEVVGGLAALHDKPSITAHPRRAGVAFLVWTESTTAFGPASAGVRFVRTEDGGRHWSSPVTAIPADPAASAPHNAQLLVAPDGTLVLVSSVLPSLLQVAGEYLPHRIVVSRSHDDGATWTPAETVVAFETRGPSFVSMEDPETGEPIQAPSAFADADMGPDGTITVAWRHAGSDEDSEVRVARSSDLGRSWAEPVTVSAPGAHVFLPTVATDRAGGIGVLHYDVRDDRPGDAPLSAAVWLSTSRDGGRTWTERLLTGGLDLRSAPDRRIPAEGRFLGDYQGLVGLPAGFGIAFVVPGEMARVGASDVFYAEVRR